MDVCVIGLGKIGLPFAIQAAGRGHRVFGADVSPRVVNAVSAGQEPFHGEFDLQRRLQDVVADGRLTATTDTTWATSNSEVVVIIVPLGVTEAGGLDFGALDSVTDEVAAGLRPGTLVSYETTLPVHTTRGRLANRLASVSGLRLGEELFVVHSPERVFSGRVFADLRRYPKLVGGIDDRSTERGVDFYRRILEFDERVDLGKENGVWPMRSAETAELAKIAETTYRNVNIGLANEFARFSEVNEIDIHEVIEAANSQPFSNIHNPGIAVGGHCIPVYPKFYLSNDPEARLPASAVEVNESMPAHAVETIRILHGSLANRIVVILGASYRGGIKEAAFSGAAPLAEALTAQGAVPLVHDPMFDDEELADLGFESYRFGEPCDIAVLQADHDEYRSLSTRDLPGVQLVYDGRGCLDPNLWVGVELFQLGVGVVQHDDGGAR